MKILILGSKGQLGSAFKLIASDYSSSFFFLDRSIADLTDAVSIISALEKIEPDVIVNCAAYTSVDEAEVQTALAHLVNHEAVKTIATWCSKQNVCFVHYSTDYVFDGKSDIPYTEGDTPNPINEYGRSKYLGEQAFLHSGCRGFCLRVSWLHSNVGKNFFRTMKKLLSQKDVVEVVIDQYGTPTTANFVVHQTLRLIELHDVSVQVPKLLHLVPTGHTNWYEFAKHIHRRLSSTGGHIKCDQIRPVSSKRFGQHALRPEFSVLSNDMLRQLKSETVPSWQDCHESLYGDTFWNKY